MSRIQPHQWHSLIRSIAFCDFREIHNCIELNKPIRFEFYLKEIKNLLEHLESLNLQYVLGDKNFRVIVDSNMDGWSSSLVECTGNDKDAMCLIYIHTDKNVCEKAKLFDSKDDDLNFGQILQYPKCCIEAYLNWQKDNEDIDPITIITNSFLFNGQIGNFDFPSPFSRYFGSGLYSHFPCSLNCEPTKEIARHSLASMKRNFPEAAKRILMFEDSLVIFNKEKGISLWTKYEYEANKIHLSKTSFHGQGELKKMFAQIEIIEISGSELLLFSELKQVVRFNTNNCFIGIFNSAEAKQT